MDVWLWISELPNSPEWTTSNSPLVYQLASSNPTHGEPQSIQLLAERVTSKSGSDTGKWVTFSIHIEGFEAHTSQRTLLVSDPCPLLSDKSFLPLVVQLVQEIVDRSPASPDSSVCPSSHLQKLKPDPIAWILETHSPESFSGFFALIFLTRLFWLCAFDAPSPVGSLYFKSFLEPNLEMLARESHMPVMRAFLLASGVDVERCIARAVGYILVKCLILRDMSVGLKSLAPPQYNMGVSYATEAHGVWLLKSYAPVWSMKPTRSTANRNAHPFLVEAKESALRYTLAHQQLESVVQLEYSVKFHEDYIQVRARVDNLRFHIVKLGFNNKNGNEDVFHSEETYFPSRIRVWVGPEFGSNYVTSLSLGKSTENPKREVEMQRIMKGSLGKTKAPRIKATSRTSTRMKMRNWRWDQDAEGNSVLYDGVLHDTTSGVEVYCVDSPNPGGGGAGEGSGDYEFRRCYVGGNRAFTKSKGVVFAGDECGEEVRWRVSKEMEGSVLKWRVGGKVWVSYWPSEVKSCYCETRCMEWYDEVDLPLIATK